MHVVLKALHLPLSLLLLALCAALRPAVAAPWIEPGDARLRHHIQLLADAGLIRVPVNTWPLMWSGVISEVKRSKGHPLTPAQWRAVQFIERAFAQQTQRVGVEARLAAGEQINPLRGFGDSRRGEQEAQVSIEYLGENWAGRLRGNWADDPLDDDSTHLDGSYLAALWGNWAFTVGALERWWGPARESALILSNNARPVPGLSLQRNGSEPFRTPWLSWLGPWQLVAFAGRLEDERVVPGAKLVGARLSIRPLPWLELGASRTAQWGGEGRPQSLSSFKNLVLGRDNRGSEGISLANEPGNQLGGVDWRASWAGERLSAEFYGETVGEDEVNGAPSKNMVMFGVGATYSTDASDWRLYYETADTLAGRFNNDDHTNTAYEHGIYQSGYRYRSRVIGASVDNDSRAHVLGLQWHASQRNSFWLKLAQYDLNTDGSGAAFSDGNSVSVASSNDYAASLGWQHRRQHWQWGVSYQHFNDGLRLRQVDSGDDALTVNISAFW